MTRRRLRGFPLGLVLTLLLVTPPPVAAATFTVTCDGGAPAQLFTFVNTAFPGDTILIPTCTIVIPSTLVINTHNVTITGAGPGSTILDGGGVRQVVSVSAGGLATIAGVTIRNGRSAFGAGIANSGTLAVINSSISDNTAGVAPIPGLGGGIWNFGRLTVTNSTISGNTGASPSLGNQGGGIFNAGVATLTMTNSTVSGNTVLGVAGAVDGQGGGIYNGGTLTVTNSTISGNTAAAANGTGGEGGGIWNFGQLTVTNATITGNTAAGSAGSGGGLYIEEPFFQAAILQNTIVAANTAALSANCDGPLTSSGHNLSSGGSCAAAFTAVGDLNNVAPGLGPLQNNGGPTLTHALLPGSPALDAGGNAVCPVADQRGSLRPLDGSGGGLAVCDIGAVEVRPPVLVSTGTGPGGGPHVKLFRVSGAGTPTPLGPGFMAYDPGFMGGVQATLVQVGGEQFIVTGAGSGGGPHVKLFKVTDRVGGVVTQIGPGFMAYDPGFTGGARVAATTDPTGNLLIVTGAGPGGGPHVKVFQVTDLTTGDVIQLGGGFMAYDPAFTGGVNVGAE